MKAEQWDLLWQMLVSMPFVGGIHLGVSWCILKGLRGAQHWISPLLVVAPIILIGGFISLWISIPLGNTLLRDLGWLLFLPSICLGIVTGLKLIPLFTQFFLSTRSKWNSRKQIKREGE